MKASTSPSDVPMPRSSILPDGDLVRVDEGLEFPGDDPVEQAEADGEARIVEREEDVAEAQQVAPALLGIALGRLRLERLALALGPRACSGLQRRQRVLHVLHRLLDDALGRLGVALEVDVVLLGPSSLRPARTPVVSGAAFSSSSGRSGQRTEMAFFSTWVGCRKAPPPPDVMK